MAERDQGWLRFGWIVSYPLLALLATAIYLSAVEIAQPSRPRVAPAPVVADSPDWSAAFGARVETLHAQVKSLVEEPLGAKVAREDRQGGGSIHWTHRVLELMVDPGRRAEVASTIEALRAASPGVTVTSEDTFNGTRFLIGLDGLLTHTVLVVWSDQPTHPRVAIVVLALGDDLRQARDVIEIGAPVAVAIRPGRPFSAQVAELAKMFECDVVLDWRAAGEGDELGAALATVPGAIGVALSEPRVDGEVYRRRVAEIHERGLFALAAEDAGGAGPFVAALPMSEEDGPAFDLLTRRVRSGGSAVGLASGAGPAELKRLRSMVSKWNEGEIEVVKVSQLFGKVERPAT